jgi:hypothetical protein
MHGVRQTGSGDPQVTALVGGLAEEDRQHNEVVDLGDGERGDGLVDEPEAHHEGYGR